MTIVQQASDRYRTLVFRILAATVAIGLFGTMIWLLRWYWMTEAAEHATTAEPRELLWCLSLLAAGILGLMQPSRFGQIFVMTVGGLIVGDFVWPAISMRPADRLVAARSGDVSEFTTAAICLCGALGAILGQNLVEIRRLLEWLDSASPRLFRS
jgi:hypothetical protein